jgi:hypothetical protein
MVREVDIQPSHPGSSSHRQKFGFLLLFKKHCMGFSYRIPFKKTLPIKEGNRFFCHGESKKDK